MKNEKVKQLILSIEKCMRRANDKWLQWNETETRNKRYWNGSKLKKKAAYLKAYSSFWLMQASAERKSAIINGENEAAYKRMKMWLNMTSEKN